VENKVTATTDKRDTKPARDLEPGDWLAADEVVEQVCSQVLSVHPYIEVELGSRVMVAYANSEGTPTIMRFHAGDAVQLASPLELAEARVDGDRRTLTTHLYALADLIEHHDLPLPEQWAHLDFHFDNVEAVAEIGRRTGIPVVDDTAGRHSVTWPAEADRGGNKFRVEWFTYAKEPEPEPAADPTGLDYGRGDTEADDPTPVSPARVPMHTGGVVDGGELVDETPADPTAGVFDGLPDCSADCGDQPLTQDSKHFEDCPRGQELDRRLATARRADEVPHETLVARGLMTDDGELTDAGREGLREAIAESMAAEPCYVPNGFTAPEVIRERIAECAARHPGTPCRSAAEPDRQTRPLVSDETIAEASAMAERDRAAGGSPWEVPDHPDNSLPGGWHHGQIRGN